MTRLPILALEAIASYLDFNSLVSLAKSTSSLAHLRPNKQLVAREDFSYWSEYSSDPEPFVDVDIQTRRLLAIKIVWQWQGEWQDPQEAQALCLPMQRFQNRSLDESSDESSDDWSDDCSNDSSDESSDGHISNCVSRFHRRGGDVRQAQLMLVLVRADKVWFRNETFFSLNLILSI